MNRINGEWRGYYNYRGAPDLGDGFTAFLSESEGQLEGKIVDDNGPGAADVSGSFSFPSICFTKTYGNPGPLREVEEIDGIRITTLLVFSDPVEYEGSMSDDGKTLRGTWTILNNYGSSTGAWTAHRIEEEQEETAKSQRSKDKIKRPVLEDQGV